MDKISRWISEKTGSTKQTVDHEFELLWSKQETLHETTKTTIKHLNQTIENIHAFQTNMGFLAEDFLMVYDKSESQREVPEKMRSVSESIQKNCCVPYQNGVTAGVQKLMQYQVKFENLHELRKLREERRKEYDFRRGKVESLTEKPSKNPLELPKEKEKLAIAKEEYETMNDEAKAQIEQIFIEKHNAFDAVLPIVIRETMEYQKRVMGDLQPLGKYSDMKVQVTTTTSRQVKTQQTQPEKKQAPPLASRTKSVVSKVPPKFDVEWFYLDDAMNQCGPISYNDLKNSFKKGSIHGESYVFEANMSDWAQVNSIKELEMNLKK
eukprot:gene1863-1004_t